jgi:hypothetical protein
MFVFQIQPIKPALQCSIIHASPAENRKGTSDTLLTLGSFKQILQNQFGFRVVGFVFDGDSCFNRSHDEFTEQWKALLEASPPLVPNSPDTPVQFARRIFGLVDCTNSARELSLAFRLE